MKLAHLKLLLLLPLLLLLIGCQDYGKMKQHLVVGYKGLDAYCLYVGRITGFPYLAEPITDGNTQEDNDFYTNRLNNERLPAFEQAGLLTSDQAVGKDGKSYPLYRLTDEGKQYYKSPKAAAVRHRDDLKDAQFCFGRREILEVTDIRDRETDFYGGRTTETIVDFTYNLNDVPAWVNHPAITALDAYGIDFSRDPKNKEGEVYLTKKGGTYYNYGTGRTIETLRLGYYL
ncbi:hypothetical protein RHO14_09735 [Orbus wheelerorum]|uniref:hypothetical protein n=1 Tax=Orbus wheelerorum TaxID=3074111 RepID=UPI00370D672E